MPKGVYIHIPFCEHICYYCDFNKFLLDHQPVWGYLRALQKEMQETLTKIPSESIQTIYIGGGTPTALDSEQMAFLMDSIQEHLTPKSDDLEFTIEANPGNLDREKLAVMKAGGVNRLSLGVQSFDDRLLAEIGRTHRSKDVFEAVELVREAGFDNLSIDLMFRLPQQTLQVLDDTLQTARSLDVNHISIYSLQVEPRTIFHNRMKKGHLPLPDEDVEADMFEHVLQVLGGHGLHHYEISNFAKAGYESRHNQLYWENEEYYGLGAGAHGYVNSARRVNAGWFKKYMRLIEEQGDACVEKHPVGVQEKMEDEMFLGLREARGLSRKRFRKRYGRDMQEAFGESMNRLFDRGLLAEDGDRIYLTHQGLFLGNDVFQEFINV